MRYGEMGEAAPPRNGHGGSGGATNGTSGEWGPFKSAASYGTSMAVVICLLFSAFAFGLLLMAAGRFLLRRLRRVPPEKPVVLSSAGGGAAIVYAAGETELADSAAVCAICLSEFADGETVRVLSPCRHGFHAECVEAWWAASAAAAAAAKPPRRSSPPCCPLCRAFVCLSSPAPETKAQITVGSSGA